MRILNVVFVIFFLMISVNALTDVTLSDQGTSVKNISTGTLLDSGEIQITVWNDSTGGIPVYNETFTDAIHNGSWNLMIGSNVSNPLSLEMNRNYYKDYEINGTDINFTYHNETTVDRFKFISPVGDLNWTFLQNYPASCPAEQAIAQIDDTITCVDLSVYNDTVATDALNTSKLNLAGGIMTGNLILDNDTHINLSGGSYINFGSNFCIFLASNGSGVFANNVSGITCPS